MKTYTCKCGRTVIEGEECPVQVFPVDEEILNKHLNQQKELECSGCHMMVSLKTILEQGKENWRYFVWFKTVFCPGCSHALGFDRIK